MPEVTRILSRIEQGDAKAADQLFPLVYEELRKLADAKLNNERPGHTLQATALVHEVYLRLVGSADGTEIRWDGRGHFFAAAAESMRRILINNARDKLRLKRGGDRRRLDLEKVEFALGTPDEELIALDEALDQLTDSDPLGARVVNLKFFAGLTLQEVANSLGVSRRTADRHWAYAKAWLYDRLADQETPESD